MGITGVVAAAADTLAEAEGVEETVPVVSAMLSNVENVIAATLVASLTMARVAAMVAEVRML